MRPGHHAKVALWRDDRELELEIEIGRRPTPRDGGTER
jgi:hypothetical protein